MKSIPANLPLSCAIAFKEWEGICAALAKGRQSMILRKGHLSPNLFHIHGNHVASMPEVTDRGS